MTSSLVGSEMCIRDSEKSGCEKCEKSGCEKDMRKKRTCAPDPFLQPRMALCAPMDALDSATSSVQYTVMQHAALSQALRARPF
eukprot:11369571-Prorocentrum_lima.AAC.1